MQDIIIHILYYHDELMICRINLINPETRDRDSDKQLLSENPPHPLTLFPLVTTQNMFYPKGTMHKREQVILRTFQLRTWVFFGEYQYTRFMLNIVISTKKIKFHHGFWGNIINCFVEFKLLFQKFLHKSILFRWKMYF